MTPGMAAVLRLLQPGIKVYSRLFDIGTPLEASDHHLATWQETARHHPSYGLRMHTTHKDISTNSCRSIMHELKTSFAGWDVAMLQVGMLLALQGTRLVGHFACLLTKPQAA